jgi:hypothetical protein
MLIVESDHGPGVVGFTGGELARYHGFTMAWGALNVPVGTKEFDGLGYDTACNSNSIVEYMRTKCPEAEWVFIMDDDHVFAPDALMNMLDKRVDVLVPLYAQRRPPFRPCIYKAENADGSYHIHDWPDLEGKGGLLPVVSAGKAGVLLRRRVIDALAVPHFEWNGVVGEDHYFFKKCRAAGFQPYVDLDTTLGHLTSVPVFPFNKDGRWCGKVDLGGAFVEFWAEQYQGAVGGTA